MYSAKRNMVPDKIGDDLPISWLETMSSQKTGPVSLLSLHLWSLLSYLTHGQQAMSWMNELSEPLPRVTCKKHWGYFSIALHILPSLSPLNTDDHVLPFLGKDNIPCTLTPGEVLFVIFPSEMINLCLEVHVVSLMALVTKSEIHSGGKNQELKGQPNGVSKSSSEEFRLTS